MLRLFAYVAVSLVITHYLVVPSLSQDLEAGRLLAEDKCGRCHATGVDDKSKLATAPPFRVLASRYPVENLAEALAEGIVTGHPSMPEFVLNPDEIDNLLSFIDWLGAQKPAK
ncbi:MAG: c-type cytochrome [Hyphomicrobiaceae bacterium]